MAHSKDQATRAAEDRHETARLRLVSDSYQCVLCVDGPHDGGCVLQGRWTA